jgi:hypothetical protein
MKDIARGLVVKDEVFKLEQSEEKLLLIAFYSSIALIIISKASHLPELTLAVSAIDLTYLGTWGYHWSMMERKRKVAEKLLGSNENYEESSSRILSASKWLALTTAFLVGLYLDIEPLQSKPGIMVLYYGSVFVILLVIVVGIIQEKRRLTNTIPS